MAAKGKTPKWDPYETSQKREFFYRPAPRNEFARPATSKAFRDCCYSPSPGPLLGPTAYTEDFCWKPLSKTEGIRTGSASGQRRNNPHPSQGFLTWRLPKGALPSCAGGSRPPRPGPASQEEVEVEIQRALTAQYRSTYRSDFLGLPQAAGHVTSPQDGGGLVPVRSRQQLGHYYAVLSEMRDDYRQPELSVPLQDNLCATAASARHRVHCRGIVPTVVQRHIRDRREVSELTTYDAFFGKKAASAVPCVLKSLQPQELQRLCNVLPEKDKEVMKSLRGQVTGHEDEGKERKLPAVTLPPSPPLEWISSWPGPH